MKNISSFKSLLLFQVILITIPLTGNSLHNSKGKLKKFEDCNKIILNTTITGKESKFLNDAAAINLEEIQWGKLAEQKGITADIKELGKMMADAHSTYQEELLALAEKKSIAISTLPTDNAQNAYIKLKSSSETNFDTEYCNMVVTAHKNAIKVFQKAARQITDTEIKKWSTATLQQLRKHLAYAQACQNKSEKIEITRG